MKIIKRLRHWVFVSDDTYDLQDLQPIKQPVIKSLAGRRINNKKFISDQLLQDTGTIVCLLASTFDNQHYAEQIYIFLHCLQI